MVWGQTGDITWTNADQDNPVRKINAGPLANSSAFWAGQVEN